MKLKKLQIALFLDNKDRALAITLVNKIDNFVEHLMANERINTDDCDYNISCA